MHLETRVAVWQQLLRVLRQHARGEGGFQGGNYLEILGPHFLATPAFP